MMMMMTGLIFMWLLPLTGSSPVTSGQPNNLTNVTAGEEIQNEFTSKQLTTKGVSDLEQVSEISGLTSTPPTTENVFTPSLQTSQTTPPTRISVSTETTGASISSTWMDFTTSTDKRPFKVKTTITTVQTSPSSDQTSPSTKPSQSRSTGTPPASQVTNKTSLSTATPPQKTIISTDTTSIQPINVTSTSSHPVPGGDAAHLTSSYKTTAVRPLTSTSKAMKKLNDITVTNHGKVVATVIGGALFLMMLGFLLIYIKKQTLQKQQMTTTDWAGPSPFLEGRSENEKITLRSSNRISLSSFLPQRLSKRMSLHPETDEELQDLTPGVTFGGKHQEITSDHSVDGKTGQEKTEHDGGVPYVDSKGEDAEAAANSASETSNGITGPSNSTLNNSEAGSFTQDDSVNPPNPSGLSENSTMS